MSTSKPRATLPSQESIERAKLAAARSELAASTGSAQALTDTDRIDALITLFGGHYAFPVLWEVRELFQNGRCGLDAFLADNPTLLPKAQNEVSQRPDTDSKQNQSGDSGSLR